MRTIHLLTAITLFVLAIGPNVLSEEGKISDQEFRELRLLYETHLMSFPRYDVTIETKKIGVPRKGISDHGFVSYEETETIRQQLDVDAKRYSFAYFSTTHQVVPVGQTSDPVKMSTKEITRQQPYVWLYHDGVERRRINFSYPWISSAVDPETSIRRSGNLSFIPAVWATLNERIRLETFSLEKAASEQLWIGKGQKVTKRLGDSVWLTTNVVMEQSREFTTEVVINRKHGAIERITSSHFAERMQRRKRNIEVFYETIDGVARPMRARSEEWASVSLDVESSHYPPAELLINRTYTWHAFGDQDIQWMDIKKDYTAKEIEAFVKAK